MSDQLKKCSSLIRAHFQLSESEITNADSIEDLEIALTHVIGYLLDKDFNRLLNAMYKIDLSEQKLKEILVRTPPGELAVKLAKEVITRELQKIKMRKKYKNQ